MDAVNVPGSLHVFPVEDEVVMAVRDGANGEVWVGPVEVAPTSVTILRLPSPTSLTVADSIVNLRTARPMAL